MSLGDQTINLNPQQITFLIHSSDHSSTSSIRSNPSDSESTVQEPDTTGDVDPDLVPPVPCEEIPDMQEACNEHQCGQDLVRSQEHLVHLLSDRQNCEGPHEAYRQRGDDAPVPVRQLTLSSVIAPFDKVVKEQDGVHDSLVDADVRDPAVQEQEGAVTPVGDPDEDVVARAEEEEGQEEAEGEDACTVTEHLYTLHVVALETEVRLESARGLDHEYHVDDEHVADVQGLGAGGHDTHVAHHWDSVAMAPERLVEDGIDAAAEAGVAGQESEKR